MKIYVAAKYSRKEEIAECVKQLEAAKFKVVSTWHTEPHGPKVQLKDLKPSDHTKYATRDLDELEEADMLLFFGEAGDQPRGGRHVEFGYALKLRIPILAIGPHENIFHYLPSVKHVPSFAAALRRLRAIHH